MSSSELSLLPIAVDDRIRRSDRRGPTYLARRIVILLEFALFGRNAVWVHWNIGWG